MHIKCLERDLPVLGTVGDRTDVALRGWQEEYVYFIVNTGTFLFIINLTTNCMPFYCDYDPYFLDWSHAWALSRGVYLLAETAERMSG